VIYLQREQGLTLAHIGVLDAFFSLVAVIGEVPTGALADAFGRKTSLALGAGLYGVGILLFGVAGSYPVLILAYVLWSLGLTLRSGADAALLYDTLKVLNRTHEYRRLSGWLLAVRHTSYALAALLGASLATVDLKTPIHLSAGIAGLSVVAVLFFKEPPRDRGELGGGARYWETVRATLALTTQSRPLQAAFLYAMTPWVIQSVIVAFMQPYAVAHGLPLGSLGLLAVVVSVGRILGGLAAGFLVTRIPESTLLALFPVVAGLSLLALWGLVSPLALAMFPLLTFMTAAVLPTVELMIQRQAPSALRATILSVYGLLVNVLYVAIRPVTGWVADAYGTSAAFLVAALALIVLALAFLGFRPFGTEDMSPR
jgi:MFS family permease